MLGGIGETRFDCCGADVDSVARPLITCVRRDDHTAEPLGSEGWASPWGVAEPDLNACEMTAASQPVCTRTWIDGSLTGCCSGLSGFSCCLFGVPPWPLVAATIGRIPSRPSSRMPLLRPVCLRSTTPARAVNWTAPRKESGRIAQGRRWRVDLINYFELNFLTGSEGFAECFIDALASETQTNYSDLAVVVDFIANNGASEEMLGREVFRAVEAALGGCGGLISEEDALAR